MSEFPAGVSIGTGEGGLPTIDIATENATARIYLYGAHVTDWTPKGSDPVLWLSPNSFFEEGSPIRGGIPICLPWFSKGPDGDKEPMHGVARLTEWQLGDVTEQDGAVVVTLLLHLEDWEARYRVSVGSELTLELTTTNTGTDDRQVEEALHTYFAVGDAARATVVGLDGASYFDKVLGEQATQVGDVTFTERTDRVYDSTSAVTLIDPGKNRRIEIEKQGSANTVVWNPWAEAAKAMADIPDAAWPHFVCVETAQVGAAASILAPGDSRTIGSAYRVVAG